MKLKFHEKGKKYIENIKLDNTTVDTDVPEHAALEEAKYFNDYEMVRLAMNHEWILNEWIFWKISFEI